MRAAQLFFCFSGSACQGCFLFLPSVAASARAQLAETCQPGSSDPILLSCAKKNGVGRQEEVAQRKPFERVFSGLFRKQKGRGPFEIPGVPTLQCLPSRAPPTYFGRTLFLACKHLLVYKMTNDLPAEQQIWQSRPPQGIFALQKSWRVGCDGGGASSQRRQSPRKEISRGNLLCAESGLPSLSYPRLLSTQKYAGTLDWYNQPYRAAPGYQRGRAPLFRNHNHRPCRWFALAPLGHDPG